MPAASTVTIVAAASSPIWMTVPIATLLPKFNQHLKPSLIRIYIMSNQMAQTHVNNWFYMVDPTIGYNNWNSWKTTGNNWFYMVNWFYNWFYVLHGSRMQTMIIHELHNVCWHQRAVHMHAGRQLQCITEFRQMHVASISICVRVSCNKLAIITNWPLPPLMQE